MLEKDEGNGFGEGNDAEFDENDNDAYSYEQATK